MDCDQVVKGAALVLSRRGAYAAIAAARDLRDSHGRSPEPDKRDTADAALLPLALSFTRLCGGFGSRTFVPPTLRGLGFGLLGQADLQHALVTVGAHLPLMNGAGKRMEVSSYSSFAILRSPARTLLNLRLIR